MLAGATAESGKMARIWQSIRDIVGLSSERLVEILLSLLVVGACIVVRVLLRRLTSRRVEDVARRYFLNKRASYLLGFAGLLVLLRIWLGGVAGLATYLGIVSAGLAIALQDPLANLAGWLFIFIRRPFSTGDRIQIGPHSGDVVDISVFQFSMVEIGNWVDADQSTGRLIHVPNGWVFKHPTCNYTQGFNFIWNELPVTVTFESDWEKAKGILWRIAEEHSAVKGEEAARQIRKAAERFMIFYDNLTPIVWTAVSDSGVTLTVRYLCAPRERRSSAAKIWEAVLRELAGCQDIDLAYPTRRVFDNAVEGKSRLRPPPGQAPP